MAAIMHLKLLETKPLPRPYGFLYLLTPENVGFRNVHVQEINISPNSSTSSHSHPMEEIFFILSGSGILKTAIAEFKVVKNTIVFISPNEPHQLINNNKVAMLKYLFIMSPPWDPDKVTYIDRNS